MAKQYQIRVEAERFIHNDLSNIADYHYKRNMKKIKEGDREAVHLDMTSYLVFEAFALEARINFVGWRVFEDEWPERWSSFDKIDKLIEALELAIDWRSRPLVTVRDLIGLRNTLAHGKPEIVDETRVVEVEPTVWEALESQWERTVNPDFVNNCREDTLVFWHSLMEAAGIEVHQTMTHGGHSLSAIGNA